MGDEDEEEEGKGWENWDAESDASDDSGGWINVESDAEIEISDSEDDKPNPKKAKLDAKVAKEEEKENEDKALEQKISKLATTKILTPADLAKLQELRLEASLDKAMGKSSKSQAQRLKEIADRHADDALTADQIEGFSKLRKSTKEEMIALAREGKGERGETQEYASFEETEKGFRRQEYYEQGEGPEEEFPDDTWEGEVQAEEESGPNEESAARAHRKE